LAKENVIVGHLIPAGIRFPSHRLIEVVKVAQEKTQEHAEQTKE